MNMDESENKDEWKKLFTKDHILYNIIYLQWQERRNLKRTKIKIGNCIRLERFLRKNVGTISLSRMFLLKTFRNFSEQSVETVAYISEYTKNQWTSVKGWHKAMFLKPLPTVAPFWPWFLPMSPSSAVWPPTLKPWPTPLMGFSPVTP